MPDPVSNAEIEDVLSSIRRLVSEEPSNARRKPQGTPRDRLVLTPAQRVPDREKPVSLPEGGREAEAAWTPDAEDSPDLSGITRLGAEKRDPVSPAEKVANTDAAASAAAPESAEDTVAPTPDSDEAEAGVSPAMSLEDRIAGLEAALLQAGGEWEPDGSEDGASDETRPLSADTDYDFLAEWEREAARAEAEDRAEDEDSEPLVLESERTVGEDDVSEAPSPDDADEPAVAVDETGQPAEDDHDALPDIDAAGVTDQADSLTRVAETADDPEAAPDVSETETPEDSVSAAQDDSVASGVEDDEAQERVEPAEEEAAEAPATGRARRDPFDGDPDELAAALAQVALPGWSRWQTESNGFFSVRSPNRTAANAPVEHADTTPETESATGAEEQASSAVEQERLDSEMAEALSEAGLDADASTAPAEAAPATTGEEPAATGDADETDGDMDIVESIVRDAAARAEDPDGDEASTSRPEELADRLSRVGAEPEETSEEVAAEDWTDHAARGVEADESQADASAGESADEDVAQDWTDHEAQGEDADEDDGFDIYADEALIDEEALREMVSNLVREELQGVLGERITRNVRRLVRREIERALALRDLS